MFYGHKNGSKNTMVFLSWALAAVSTGTGFYLVHQENDLSTTDKGYLIAAATLAAVALCFLSGIVSDYMIDTINLTEYHMSGMVLGWACLIAAMGIWWWVYNTRLVDRNDSYLLTSAIATTLAVVFLTGSVMMEHGEKIPMLDKVEKAMKNVSRGLTPRRSSPKRSSPKRSSPKRSSSRKKSSKRT
jgi:Kef-type K+ transport system membrane component KefB